MKLPGIQGIALKCCEVAAALALPMEPGKNYKESLISWLGVLYLLPVPVERTCKRL